MKEISLLEKSIINSKFFDSKIKTCSVSWKEKYLGHLIGPLGLILVVNTVAALVEKFFTQQVGAMYGEGNAAMISAMGKKYEMVMTVAKILAVATGLLVSWLISHTKSKQGRLRPWYLIFGFCSVAIARPSSCFREILWVITTGTISSPCSYAIIQSEPPTFTCSATT